MNDDLTNAFQTFTLKNKPLEILEQLWAKIVELLDHDQKLVITVLGVSSTEVDTDIGRVFKLAVMAITLKLRHEVIANLIARAPLALDLVDRSRLTLLHHATANASNVMTITLLATPANVAKEDSVGQTALSIAKKMLEKEKSRKTLMADDQFRTGVESLMKLLERGNSEGPTKISEDLEKNLEEIIKVLEAVIPEKATVEAEDPSPSVEVVLPICASARFQMVQYMVTSDSTKIEELSPNGSNLLHRILRGKTLTFTLDEYVWLFNFSKEALTTANRDGKTPLDILAESIDDPSEAERRRNILKDLRRLASVDTTTPVVGTSVELVSIADAETVTAETSEVAATAPVVGTSVKLVSVADAETVIAETSEVVASNTTVRIETSKSKIACCCIS